MSRLRYLVDDAAEMRPLLCDTLTDFTVAEASSGETALSLLRAGPRVIKTNYPTLPVLEGEG